jgi:hypothetical protein
MLVLYDLSDVQLLYCWALAFELSKYFLAFDHCSL